MGKGQSKMQIFALILLLASAVVLNLDAMAGGAASPGQEQQQEGSAPDSLLDGLLLLAEQNVAALCVLAASMISGLSAALTQKVLTGSSNSLLVSAQLGFYGILFLVVKEVFWDLGHLSPPSAALLLADGFWDGWDLWALLPVLSSALGGIVIGLVTQHAGSIMKGFALIFGLIFTGLAQWVVDGVGLKANDCFALGLVSISIYIHTSFPLVAAAKKNKKES
jgi:solute carrier family 35 (UDP-sugar transporter), member A1/2/3